MIFIDWLQINCRPQQKVRIEEDYSFFENEHYYLVDQNKHTNVFKKLHNIYSVLDHQLIAVMTSSPKQEFLDPDMIIIKFANDYLYRNNFQQELEHFMIHCKLTFRGFTRLDIAYDFNKFDNGMHPEQFIQSFIKGSINKLDKAKATVYTKNEHRMKIQGLKFGTASSNVSYMIYNKSDELYEKKDKPYIREIWKQNKLNTGNIWRLEFRISSNEILLLDTFTAEAHRLAEYEINLLKQENLVMLFNCMYNKYFQFTANDGNERIDRQPRLTLFDKFKNYRHVLINKRGNTDTSRTNKMFIKQLCINDNWCQKYIPDYDDKRNNIIEIITKKIYYNDLYDWAKDKDFIPNQVFADVKNRIMPNENILIDNDINTAHN